MSQEDLNQWDLEIDEKISHYQKPRTFPHAIPYALCTLLLQRRGDKKFRTRIKDMVEVIWSKFPSQAELVDEQWASEIYHPYMGLSSQFR
ncbi:hypothetical protein PtA15_11A323 [Puccinia triticina]|uniref:Uncharacterized protein n=1 Tax=Puccinia triticina TaxID=208348 RepID=A0ABY7CWG0_9BASI|nr:uncharacterized protein PtA15_11A323 [Puccinia triticina]WAQ89633.1 hypothetical protein PtA15_11A323 [Puccinia triticina]